MVSSGELTDRLGFRMGKRYGPERWGIDAIVQMGGDVLLLTWPGKSHPTVREGQVAAAWTSKPAGSVAEAERPSPAASPASAGASAFATSAEGIDAVQRVLTMTPEEIDALFQR